MSMGSIVGKAIRRMFGKGSNQSDKKTQGRATRQRTAGNGLRVRNNSAKWGGPPRPMPKYRSWKRQRRAGN
jgi:hypothetical protein